MVPPLSHNNWLKHNNVLDAFKASGITVVSFIGDIVQFPREFEAKHAVLIIEVMDNAGTLCALHLSNIHTVRIHLRTGQQHLNTCFEGTIASDMLLLMHAKVFVFIL